MPFEPASLCTEIALRLVAGQVGLRHERFQQGLAQGREDLRLGWLPSDPARRPESIAAVGTRLNAFLREAVAVVRERFHGKVTYAGIQFQAVDWDLFDFTTFELIRSAEVAEQFRDAVRSLVAQPKPVAINGFGTATWRGAGDVAPRSMEILTGSSIPGRHHDHRPASTPPSAQRRPSLVSPRPQRP